MTVARRRADRGAALLREHGTDRETLVRRGTNLTIVADTLVDRVELSGRRATRVLAADGRRFGAEKVVLAAGAYFSPAILIRSGIGPEPELRRLGIPVVEPLPVGERLLDHCGTDVAWELTVDLKAETASEAEAAEGLFEAHALAKAASTQCEIGSFDLHLLPWIYPVGSGSGLQASNIVFLNEAAFERPAPASLDRSAGRTACRGRVLHAARGPASAPRGNRARSQHRFGPAARGRLAAELSPGRPIMPTIPRANTNLTTAAIAERLARTL